MGGEVTKKRKRVNPEPVSKFKVGDRVKETRKTVEGFFGANTDPERKKAVMDIIGSFRKGTITGVFIKKDTRGNRLLYASVLWDGFKTPSDHAQQRLAPLDENKNLG